MCIAASLRFVSGHPSAPDVAAQDSATGFKQATGSINVLLTKFCDGTIFCALLDASVAQLAEQLTLKFGKVFSRVFFCSLTCSNHWSTKAIPFLTFSRVVRFCPKNFHAGYNTGYKVEN
jgi:hypothetical protein